jgi:Tfp pilus assembly protein PilV
MLQKAVAGRFRAPRGQRGFTLIELMYAVFFFTISLEGLACFQLVAASGTQRSADIMLATNLTCSTMEDIRVRPLAQVVNVAQPIVTRYDRWGNLGALPTYYTVSATATQVGSKPYYDLQVTTNWLAGSSTFQHGVAMQTRVPTQ